MIELFHEKYGLFWHQSVNIWKLRMEPLGEDCCSILVGYRIPAAQCSWVFFAVFCVSWCASCFQLVKGLGLQAGQCGTWSLLLWSHAVGIDAVCGLTLSCWIMQSIPWERCHLGGSTCSSKTCLYTFQQWWCLSRCAGFQFHRH